MADLKLTGGNIRYINQELGKLDHTKAWRINITEWDKKRELTANALSWVYYKMIGDFIGMTTEEVHNDCKIRFGLPILFMRKDDYAYDVAEMLNSCGFWGMPLHKQWRKIKIVAVTSEFKTKEMNKYIEEIQHFYGVQGLALE